MMSSTSFCDLLSFRYLWTIRNSDCAREGELIFVVICFHSRIFELLETATFHKKPIYTGL